MKKYIASVLRHWITGLGILLTAHGVESAVATQWTSLTTDILTELVTGLAIYVLGQGASFINIATIKSLAARFGLKL